MTKPWLLHPEAERDIDEAFAWYESKRAGLGIQFAHAIRARIAEVRRLPSASSVLYEDGEELRRVFVRTFPYWILFAELSDAWMVLTVSHRRRSDEHWRGRLKARGR
jgi:plasmid stabilization system protein ParE